MNQKIDPFLWFEKDAEAAVDFYMSVFDGATIASKTYYQEGWPGPVGEVMTIDFTIGGQRFVALNGGAEPGFTFTSAISFVVNCDTQEEVDHFWGKLSAGGQEVQCGWLKDRFGVSWQVVPTVLSEMLQDKDPEKSKRVMAAMLKMRKISIEGLKHAYEGRFDSAS